MTPLSHTAEIIGPYSPWPRRRKAQRMRTRVALAASVTAAAVFIHCITPLV